MKKFAYFMLVFSFLILSISLISFFFATRTLQTQAFYASVTVTNENVIGFDVNATALTFGKIGVGRGSSARKLILNNSYPFPIIVKTKVDGSIKPILNFGDSIRIEKGEMKMIPFNTFAGNVSEGFYEGTVELVIKPG